MEENTEVQAPDFESEARQLGWVPQEEFKGDHARWVDAQTFVERGHTIMPILRKNNERLEGTVKQQNEEIKKLRGLFEASQESISELQKVHAEATKAAVEKARKELLGELRQARMDGDVEREDAIQTQLDDLRQVQKQPEPPKPAAQGNDAVHPDFAQWAKDNSWFGSDQRKTLKAMGIAQQLRADPDNDALVGRPFFDKIIELMEDRPATTKVSESRPTNGSGAGGKRSYSDLPADAKDACERQAKKLVGEGRAFKDMKSWQSYYANLYYEGSQA